MQRVIVEGICKEFMVGFKPHQSALARFIALFSGREPKRTLRVLEGVSFTVEAGQILGVIGKNGCGKSTLLRIIAGIYTKDKGRISVNGNIISLINLATGLKPRLTMEDNLYLIGTFFGMSQKALKESFNAIVEFSELRDFVNTKIYQFSLGMMQRLVFSIAVYANPDILLLDEVFEVGDEHFRFKSVNQIKKLTKNGTSVILVSHELWMVEKYCDRVIWLDQGRVVKEGRVQDVTGEYKKQA